MHSSGALSSFTLLCDHHHHPSPEIFPSFPTETLSPLNNHWWAFIPELKYFELENEFPGYPSIYLRLKNLLSSPLYPQWSEYHHIIFNHFCLETIYSFLAHGERLVFHSPLLDVSLVRQGPGWRGHPCPLGLLALEHVFSLPATASSTPTPFFQDSS